MLCVYGKVFVVDVKVLCVDVKVVVNGKTRCVDGKVLRVYGSEFETGRATCDSMESPVPVPLYTRATKYGLNAVRANKRKKTVGPNVFGRCI